MPITHIFGWTFTAMPLVSVLLLPLLAFLDRDVGDGSEHGLSRSKAELAIILGGALIGFIAFGPWFISIGPGFSLWRATGYWHKSMAPTSVAQGLFCALRYLVWVAFAAMTIPAHYGNTLALAFLLFAAGFFMVIQRSNFGRQITAGTVKGDPEARIERLEGLAIGVAFFAYAVFLQVVTSR